MTRKPNSRYWYACYRLPDGRQKRVSTKTEDRSRARRIAEALESAVREVQSGAMTRTKAQRLVDEICLTGGVEVESAGSVRELIETYWEGRPTSELFQARRQMMLDELAQHWPLLIGGPASAIDPQHVTEFRRHLLASGNSPKTANMKLNALGAAFADAARRGDLPRNPWEGIRVSGVRAREQKRQPFTAEHANALLVKTEGEWRVLIALGYFTGQRQQQCAKLRLNGVDFDRGLVTFPPFKRNVNQHVVPLHDRLRAILAEYLAEHPEIGPDDYLLPDLSQRKSKGSMSISGRFREVILPKIGIVQPYAKQDKDKPAGRKVAPYQFHSLRHALATELARRGIPENVRMQILGHVSKQVHLGYTHGDMETARAALAGI